MKTNSFLLRSLALAALCSFFPGCDPQSQNHFDRMQASFDPLPVLSHHQRTGAVRAGDGAVNAQQQQNLAAARRIITEWIGKNNQSTARELIDPQVTGHTGLSPVAPIKGLEAYQQAINGLHDTFPDLVITINDLAATTDGRVVARLTGVGTFAKESMGLKPNHKKITMVETHMMRFRNGKLVENLVSANNLEYEMTFASVLAPVVLANLEGSYKGAPN